MLDLPKTKVEAEKHQYGAWAGEPNGRPYDPSCCCYEVHESGRGCLCYQCRRKNGFGPSELYCKQHAKKAEK